MIIICMILYVVGKDNAEMSCDYGRETRHEEQSTNGRETRDDTK